MNINRPIHQLNITQSMFLTLTFTGIWVVTWFGLTIDQRQCSKNGIFPRQNEFFRIKSDFQSEKGFFGMKTDFLGVEMKVFEMKLVKDIKAILEFGQNFIEF